MRRRLILLVAVTTSLVLVAFLVPLGILVRTAAADHATNVATQEAEGLAPLVGTVDRETLALAVQQQAQDDAADFPLSVFLPDGTVLGAPASVSPAVELARTGRSVTAARNGGREVLVAAQGGSEGTTVIRAYVPAGRLYAGVTRTWLILGLLGAVLLGLSMLVADRLARSITASSEQLARTTHRLAAGELDTRAGGGGPPELREIATGLNQLAARIGELLAAEREEVADLSHQLRTPLTALRLGVEALPDSEARGRLSAAVASLERTVDQVIQEARRPVRTGVGAGCDATEVLVERLEFWSALADDEQRGVATELPSVPVPVNTTATDLAAALDALLGNVFAHTPEGTSCAVTLTAGEEGGAVLTVRDDGPGLPDDAAIRSRGESGDHSTGLGLDIAERTAVAAGGSLHLSRAPSGGAEVTMILGAPHGTADIER